jgi:hypothetical protein
MGQVNLQPVLPPHHPSTRQLKEVVRDERGFFSLLDHCWQKDLRPRHFAQLQQSPDLERKNKGKFGFHLSAAGKQSSWRPFSWELSLCKVQV